MHFKISRSLIYLELNHIENLLIILSLCLNISSNRNGNKTSYISAACLLVKGINLMRIFLFLCYKKDVGHKEVHKWEKGIPVFLHLRVIRTLCHTRGFPSWVAQPFHRHTAPHTHVLSGMHGGDRAQMCGHACTGGSCPQHRARKDISGNSFAST